MSTVRRVGFVAGFLGCVLISGCDTLSDIIDVQPADRVSVPALFDDPSQAGLLVGSIVSQFECAFGAYAVSSGLLSNEINSHGATELFSLDSHQPDPAGGFSGLYATGDCASNVSIGTYIPLSSSRWLADKVLGALDGWTNAQVTNRSALIATAAAFAGYSYLLLGEGFCSMALDLGPELPPAQMMAKAEEKFTIAVTAAQAAGGTVGDDMGNLARVGRARTRLNLNKTADALADAQGVPAGYLKNATRALGSTLRENQVFVQLNRLRVASVGADYIDLRWNGQPDPRVVAVNTGIFRGFLQYGQTKYPSEASPLPIATGAEARLVIAEVEGGQTAVNIINELHTAAGLGPFASTDPVEIRDQVREERRRQLFIDGHRLYDRIRYDLPLSPAAGAPYRWGGVHGSAKCMPLPNVERDNNPNL